MYILCSNHRVDCGQVSRFPFLSAEPFTEVPSLCVRYLSLGAVLAVFMSRCYAEAEGMTLLKVDNKMPPMPPDAIVKREQEVVVKEEERSDERSKRRRRK